MVSPPPPPVSAACTNVNILSLFHPSRPLYIYTALRRIKMCEDVETLAPLVYAPATKYTINSLFSYYNQNNFERGV